MYGGRTKSHINFDSVALVLKPPRPIYEYFETNLSTQKQAKTGSRLIGDENQDFSLNFFF